MKTTMLMAAGLILSLVGTGCATKKYVAQTIAPVEQRVATTEGKNTEQDQKLTTQAQQLETLDRDLSRTKEQLADVDNKAGAAGDSARQANEAAKMADTKAQGAQSAADNAKMAAEKGISTLSKNVDSMLKYKELKSGSVLFAFGQKNLDAEAKATLDDLAKSLGSAERYVVEIQGHTDKVGDAGYNAILSQDRAESVARYLASEHNIPLRSINMLGTGVAAGEQTTRDERAQARRVDVRIFVPEMASAATSETTARN